MRLFVSVFFWLSVFLTLLRILLLGSDVYPRSVSRGSDAFALAVGIGYLIWAGYLLWVQ